MLFQCRVEPDDLLAEVGLANPSMSSGTSTLNQNNDLIRKCVIGLLHGLFYAQMSKVFPYANLSIHSI